MLVITELSGSRSGPGNPAMPWMRSPSGPSPKFMRYVGAFSTGSPINDAEFHCLILSGISCVGFFGGPVAHSALNKNNSAYSRSPDTTARRPR
jgi:hypothetical protein